MIQASEEQIKTTALDHHGLIAAVCKDLKIAARIDRHLKPDAQRKVSPGIAVVAMIINGLGFTNRRLYLTHQFFEPKPVKRLLGEHLEAKDITDYTLGHALDDIAEYGSSRLFAEVAFGVALDNHLLSSKNHLDTTSISVHGKYEVDDDPAILEINHGFSKDHRPDLKQFVLSLVVNGPSSIPLWMDPLSGNSSDKVSFHETIKNVESFKKEINLEGDFKWIADSALYTKDKLLKNNDCIWVTRVPETITEAKKLVEKPDEEISWIEREEEYKTAPFSSSYGGIEQRWLLIFSKQAYEREKKTLEKKIEKEREKLEQALWHFEKQAFHCEGDAVKAFKVFEKAYKLHKIDHHVVPMVKHPGRGKPKKDAEGNVVGYKIKTLFGRDDAQIDKILSRKGRFILATNQLNSQEYTDEQILSEYKEQQNVEGGFRFLKDPWFMVDSVFLKLPRRIEALMMVMTLCLMVYNVGQYNLRERLKQEGSTLPNQLGKEVQNPTLRWLFQVMEGVSLVHCYDPSLTEVRQEFVVNLNANRKKIIFLFGETAAQIYGLAQTNQADSEEV